MPEFSQQPCPIRAGARATIVRTLQDLARDAEEAERAGDMETAMSIRTLANIIAGVADQRLSTRSNKEEAMSNQFKLGQRLKDKVSGFSGIATSRVEFLNGCVRYCLQPPVSTQDPAKLPDGTYFDAEQLEYVDDGLETNTPAPKGGDRIDPPLRNSL